MSLETVSLNGVWNLSKREETATIPATVPGEVHTALLAAGRIEDPFFRENERDQSWIGESDWVYERRFTIDEAFLQKQNIRLRCEGLDTFAEVSLNGERVVETSNMFRTYEWDLKPFLKAGDNDIRITFGSVLPTMRTKQQAHELFQTYHVPWEVGGRGYIRKEQCNFGWDWGPVCITCGIWRDIQLVAWDDCRLTAPQVSQEHLPDGSVRLHLNIAMEGNPSAHTVEARLHFEGQRVASKRVTASGNVSIRLEVKDAHLWWPNGMGEQCLYDLEICLKRDDAPVHSLLRRIGLRTFELITEDDTWGQSFVFAVNGVRFFAKGANWIPADAFYNRTSPAHLRSLVKSAAEANMNMLRVWGGGVYESEAFYDLCDELGLCVWQDLMFACGAYPADDPAFVEDVLEEVTDQVIRLRHRACLILWCGNNEMEQFCNGDEWPKMPWPLYRQLFDEQIPSRIRSLDPDRRYWPSSPHSPVGDRDHDANPDCGDAHLWAVWHGREPFEWYRTACHRFCSEFGFQSYPEPSTCKAFTQPADRNITSPVMEHHQRSHEGNAKILHYMLSWFPMPVGFENTLWLSQIQQGLSIKYAVEHWRRNWPRCAGALYWQLNDCWPIASWASIDYHGRWKALHYFAKRFFAPVLVTALEDENPESASVEFHLSTDACQEEGAVLSWMIGSAGGEMLAQGQSEVALKPWHSCRIERLDLREWAGDDRKARDLLIWYNLKTESGLTCQDFASLVKPKHLALEKPNYTWRVVEKRTCFEIDVEVDKPALWAWLEMPDRECRWSDNFVCMQPGRTYPFTTEKQADLTREQLERGLLVRSIYDTYQNPAESGNQ